MNLGAGQPAPLPYGVEPQRWYSSHSMQFSSPLQQSPMSSVCYYWPPPGNYPPPPNHYPPPCYVTNPYYPPPCYVTNPYSPPFQPHFIPTNQIVPPHTSHELPPTPRCCSVPPKLDPVTDPEVPMVEVSRSSFQISDAKIDEFMKSMNRLFDNFIDKCTKGLQGSQGSSPSVSTPTTKLQSSEPRVCSPLRLQPVTTSSSPLGNVHSATGGVKKLRRSSLGIVAPRAVGRYRQCKPRFVTLMMETMQQYAQIEAKISATAGGLTPQPTVNPNDGGAGSASSSVLAKVEGNSLNHSADNLLDKTVGDTGLVDLIVIEQIKSSSGNELLPTAKIGPQLSMSTTNAAVVVPSSDGLLNFGLPNVGISMVSGVSVPQVVPNRNYAGHSMEQGQQFVLWTGGLPWPFPPLPFCSSIDFVFGDQLNGIDVTCDSEKRKIFDKNVTVNGGDDEQLVSVNVSVKQDEQGPDFNVKGREFCALHLPDEMSKSDGRCGVGRTVAAVTSIRDKGGGLAHMPLEFVGEFTHEAGYPIGYVGSERSLGLTVKDEDNKSIADVVMSRSKYEADFVVDRIYKSFGKGDLVYERPKSEEVRGYEVDSIENEHSNGSQAYRDAITILIPGALVCGSKGRIIVAHMSIQDKGGGTATHGSKDSDEEVFSDEEWGVKELLNSPTWASLVKAATCGVSTDGNSLALPNLPIYSSGFSDFGVSISRDKSKVRTVGYSCNLNTTWGKNFMVIVSNALATRLKHYTEGSKKISTPATFLCVLVVIWRRVQGYYIMLGIAAMNLCLLYVFAAMEDRLKQGGIPDMIGGLLLQLSSSQASMRERTVSCAVLVSRSFSDDLLAGGSMAIIQYITDMACARFYGEIQLEVMVHALEKVKKINGIDILGCKLSWEDKNFDSEEATKPMSEYEEIFTVCCTIPLMVLKVKHYGERFLKKLCYLNIPHTIIRHIITQANGVLIWLFKALQLFRTTLFKCRAEREFFVALLLIDQMERKMNLMAVGASSLEKDGSGCMRNGELGLSCRSLSLFDDQFQAFVSSMLDKCKGIGLPYICLQGVTNILLGMILKALEPHEYFGSNGDYISERTSLLKHSPLSFIDEIKNGPRDDVWCVRKSSMLVAGIDYRTDAAYKLDTGGEHVSMITSEDRLVCKCLFELRKSVTELLICCAMVAVLAIRPIFELEDKLQCTAFIQNVKLEDKFLLRGMECYDFSLM